MTTETRTAADDPLRQGLATLPGSRGTPGTARPPWPAHHRRSAVPLAARYEDLTDVRRIAELTEGELQTVQGEVVEIEGHELLKGGCTVSVVLCDDGRHCLEGIWFNQPYAASRFRQGQRLAFSGKPKWFRDFRHNRQHWQMSNPRVQLLDGSAAIDASGGIVPVYPLTENLRATNFVP